jgi:hypothetical protein
MNNKREIHFDSPELVYRRKYGKKKERASEGGRIQQDLSGYMYFTSMEVKIQ